MARRNHERLHTLAGDSRFLVAKLTISQTNEKLNYQQNPTPQTWRVRMFENGNVRPEVKMPSEFKDTKVQQQPNPNPNTMSWQRTRGMI